MRSDKLSYAPLFDCRRNATAVGALSGREDSNLRPLGPQPSALTGLRHAPRHLLCYPAKRAMRFELTTLCLGSRCSTTELRPHLGDHGAEGIRTPDLLNAIQALYQLSYSPPTSATLP